jgi:prepilin-type N-terminal cleavage/methylation domain-containing protein
VRPRPLSARCRDERGFGMIELLAAMTVMLIGIIAVYGLFQSGLVQLRRASTKTTAAALADAQMERFRAVKYETLGIDATQTCASGCSAAVSVYRGDTAYPSEMAPARTRTGAGLTPTSSPLTVASAAGFPASAEFRIKVDSETLLVTEGGSSTTTWTVTRAVDGSVAASHSTGAAVTHKQRVDVANCSGGGSPCTTIVPTTTATGADRNTYRVDTYVNWTTVTNSSGTAGRALKQITIVVRDAAAPYRTWARVTSIFDEATGL